MKRHLTIALITALLALACGPPVEEPPPPPPRETPGASPEAVITPPPPERTIVRVNNGPRAGEEERQAEWDLMEAMFEERHPEIDIVVSDWEFDPQAFTARAMSGDLETVINTWATEGFRMIEQGMATDITDLMEEWAPTAELDRQVSAPFRRGRRWFAMPIYAYSMALYLDRSVFEQAGLVDAQGEPLAPATWEELRETARRLTDPDIPRYGFLMQGENPRGGWHFLNWGWQAGGVFEERGVNGLWEATFASPQIARAYGFLQAMRWEDRSIQPNNMTRYREAWQMFAAGQAAMIMDAASEHLFNALKDEYGYDLENIFVAPLPAGPAGRAHQVGGDYLMITSQATEDQRRAAFEWMTWHHDPEWLDAKFALWEELKRAVGYPQVPIFHGEFGEQRRAIVERHRTFPRFPAYEEGVRGTLHPEPPVACQALYREVLSPTLQAVLGDPEADALEILESLVEPFERQHIAPLNAQIVEGQEDQAPQWLNLGPRPGSPEAGD